MIANPFHIDTVKIDPDKWTQYDKNIIMHVMNK